jgi:hypothetical protein
MKKMLLSLSVLSIIVMLTSYRLANRINADILSILGYTKSNADEYIMGSVTSGLPWLIRPSNFAQIITMSGSEKATLAKDFCVYIKSYVYSQEFKDKYEAYRQSQKPHVSQLSEEEKAAALEMIAQQEELFSPEVLEMLPPESREGALQSIVEMKASVNGELTATQKADWEAKVPSNPYTTIKSGLQRFLDETKDVDFSATTYLKEGKKIFTNPVYEQKNGQWKACYRAGKEVTDVGRSFAQEWLAELN